MSTCLPSQSEFEMAVSDHVTCMQKYSIHPRMYIPTWMVKFQINHMNHWTEMACQIIPFNTNAIIPFDNIQALLKWRLFEVEWYWMLQRCNYSLRMVFEWYSKVIIVFELGNLEMNTKLVNFQIFNHIIISVQKLVPLIWLLYKNHTETNCAALIASVDT